MKNALSFLVLAFLFLYQNTIQAQFCANAEKGMCCTSDGWSSDRPDGNAPIGVMGDHYHGANSLMFSYRYMYMSMEGNRAGSEEIADSYIYPSYMMSPQNMDMQMHMFGMMYAPSNRITLMAMTNYLFNEMNMLGMDGTRHFHESRGLGDTRLTAIAGLWVDGKNAIHANGGISAPTGSIAETEMVHQHHGGHHEVESKIPYPMQLGTGTWDVLLGLTYLGQVENFSWGGQLSGTFPTGENTEGYRWGNKYQLTGWGAYRLNNFISLSIRTAGTVNEKMVGADADITMPMSPTSDAINFGGEQVNGFAGINFLIPSGMFRGIRLGLEYGQPLYQNANGIQMNQNQFITLGLKYSRH